MTTEKYLNYRGDVKASAGVGDTLWFVTAHAENHPTGVYRLDADKLTLAVDALPAGAVALAADGDTVWIAGSDRQVYRISANGGTPKPLGQPLAQPLVALALLANDRLGVLAGQGITILSRKDGAALQTLDLTEPGTCLTADKTGQWLVAGTQRGTVAVFESEGKPRFEPSASERLHDGAVTALLFENEDLRFYSAGADQKLYSTHARGKLEPEDRGRGNNHAENIARIIWAPGDRFLTGSKDKTVKSWQRGSAHKPATLKDGVGAVVDLATVTIHNHTLLAAACEDNTLRFFEITADGKFGDATHRVYGAIAWAKNELAQNDSTRREVALKALAGWDDAPSVELIAEQVSKDADHALRLLAAQLLAGSKSPKAAKLLEKTLGHADEAVRVASFHGLRKQLGDHDLKPLELALRTDKADVGRLAVQALETRAKQDDQALARLVGALDAKTLEIRQAALFSLEKVHPTDSPEADLVALASKQADLRRLALVRLYQRSLLTQAGVPSALRRRTEDQDAEVRRVAYLLSLHTRPRLLASLRERDAELNRQLTELESAAKMEPSVAGKIVSQVRALAGALTGQTVNGDDHEPLLQATASRSLDTCLRGARGLAVIGDPRAFGLLLQLSREEDAGARVEVCRALAALDDPRGIKRLRSLLYDTVPAVRDAAFSALVKVHDKAPLEVAESGLNAAFEDVRRRGLQVLVDAARKSMPTSANDLAWQLLVRALNDSFPGVRSEAFKSVLNLQAAGGGIKTLRFALQSIHADVRREVLTEVMAQANEPWAWNLLLEFYDDHDPRLRAEAFDFATKKNKELEPLAAALRGRFPDVRKLAVEALVKKHSEPAQALLVKALDDAEKEIRQLALASLVGADAQGPLRQALKSQHADVRLKAAQALARHGETEALGTLTTLATAPEPAERERQPDWAALVEGALEGLAELGDVSALPHLTPLLHGKHIGIRKAAAQALAWVALPNHTEPLRQAMQHADAEVKYRAALGLAYAGDASVASLVFSDAAGRVLSPQERLVAALALGPAGEDQLVVFLDGGDDALRRQALVLLMLLELKENQGTPSRCLACLASRMPRVRLSAARALENFADPAAFAQHVAQVFNDRGDETAWKVAPDAIDTLAELVAHGAPSVRARSVHLLRLLADKEQAAFDQAWAMHTGRFLPAIAALRQQPRPAAKSRYTPVQLQQLAFGAYVGLVREQSSAGGKVASVRQTALARILALAKKDKAYAQAAVPVFVQALGDPNQEVRLQAFDQLLGMGIDRATLGAEALETGHTDLGVKGLELLSGGATTTEGQAVLEQVTLNRKDDLALEAAKLLIPARGVVAVAVKTLEAAHEAARTWGVQTLAAEYDRGEDARAGLRKALTSRYRKLREAAANELAVKKDPAAFDALSLVLMEAAEAGKQRKAIASLVNLGDPRTPDAFLKRLENDPAETAVVDDLLRAAADFRKPETANRMLALTDHKRFRSSALAALVVVSGFDQEIDDPEDERHDRRWEEKQYPRHTGVLARVMERCLTLGETEYLTESLLDAARWARGKEVDPVLAQLAFHPDEDLRRSAVEVLGWRLRKRGGPAEPLLKGLQHKDAETQFSAAEGLARAGRPEGLNVLMAAVDLMDDRDYRERAVKALGELADARALELLLKLAGEEGHALQDAAVEAIGHLGKTPKADEVFKLLERHAKGDGSAADAALKALRWFNTHAGWQIVRRRAVDTTFIYRDSAIEELGYNDDPATRDLLLHMLATDGDDDMVTAALVSARRLWGDTSLEPDYALLQTKVSWVEELVEEALKRVTERGDPKRMFEVLPKCGAEVQEQLATNLLNRVPPPLAEAQAAIRSTDEKTAQLAAQVLGRAGAASAGSAAAIQEALTGWLRTWEELRRHMARRGEDDPRLVGQVTPCVQSLVWAAGRLGVPGDALLRVASARPGDTYFRPIRLEAVSALTQMQPSDAVRTALEKLAAAGDPEVRTLAADAVGRLAASQAAPLAERMLSDRVSFNRLAAHAGAAVAGTLRTAAGQVHYQGVALPHLIARADVDGLAAVAENRSLPEATRLGAIEGLAKLGRDDAEERLQRVGSSESQFEELRKAAWRALRRSKRARQKVAP